MESDYVVRFAQIDDFGSIIQLLQSPDIKWFGNIRPKYNAKDNIFKTYQTHRLVVLKNEASTGVIAYAEVRDYPPLGALPNDAWLKWMNYRYCLTFTVNTLNTLFLNFGAYKSDHPLTIRAILKEVFYTENKVLYLMTVKMPKTPQHKYYYESFSDLKPYARVLYPREFDLENNPVTQSLYVVYRYDILPKINYRKALAEDNDDIIEIQEAELPEIRAELGDYYIAEELMRQDEAAHKTFIIVAEIENISKEFQTGGFIWLSTDIDIKYFVKNYEVEHFGNLVNFTETEPYALDHFIVSTSQPKAEISLFTLEALDDLHATTILGGLHRNDSGISVASLGKVKVSSLAGMVVCDDKYYVREGIFIKFYHIVDHLLSNGYYLNEDVKVIDFCYNVAPDLSILEDSANVFMLKYIGIHSDYPVKRLFNFLICAFCAFPERDYCIMTLPKGGTSVRSHAEVLKYFMPVAQRPSEVTNLDQLYITHRSIIHGDVSVYRIEPTDVQMIQKFALDGYSPEINSVGSSTSYASKINEYGYVEREYKLLNQIMNSVLYHHHSEFSIWTIRCGDSTKPASENTLIGFVVLKLFRNRHQLYHHYHVPKYDTHQSHECAEIITLRLHPLFRIWSDIIFRDLASKTNYHDFFYISSRRNTTFSNELKTYMMLVEPNPKKKCSVPCSADECDKMPLSKIKLPQHNFYTDHLILFRHKLKPSKWFGNTNKLVMIGFTEHTKAFLRQLAFQWDSKDHKNSETFTCLTRIQVTVISMPGLVEAEYDNMFRCPFCKDMYNCYLNYQNSSCYIRDVILRMDLRLWVHFVPGHVIFIDKEKKFVRLRNSCEIYYDTLIMTCHKNYSLNVDSPVDYKGRLPSNYVEVNFRIDKFLLFYKCRVLLEDMQNSFIILIYGNDLQTYECIQFLTTHGISSKRIILAMPHEVTGVDAEDKLRSPYKDKNIQYILEDMVRDSGVTVYNNLNFVEWTHHISGHFIMEVVFESFPSHDRFNIDCDIFISFATCGHIGYFSKPWIVASDIEMHNGCIVVDENFRTNDPNIYAVGRHIEIRGKPNYQYKYTSERETARKLMQILKLGFCEKRVEHKFSEPLYFQAQLPFNYYITKVTMPRRYLSTQLSTDMSCSLTTYSKKNFCRVTLSRNSIVEEIVVITNDDTRLDHLEHFVGKHESLLNNLKARYAAGALKCFLKFFKEPWTELIMHEDFEDLQVQNYNMLRPTVLAHQIKTVKDITDHEFFKMNKGNLEEGLLNFLRKRRTDFHHPFALPEDYLDMFQTE
ncbi:cilia- and flagella-associated protein 61 [Scaptodrosophila lebanonensis]|uniref:Cilia- and flagella-associated protein 61 n=1 Tax=Drosophila lebanonensis TaxID=7225 RepID=A0A6J2UHS9_DROLE|nr:cilia- and flagella-associated protein 61 [Scaptodrosophila lebanonensis]